jgi:hypothetical protein
VPFSAPSREGYAFMPKGDAESSLKKKNQQMQRCNNARIANKAAFGRCVWIKAVGQRHLSVFFMMFLPMDKRFLRCFCALARMMFC